MEHVLSRRPARTWRKRILGLPIFYKVLVANSLIVVAGAIVGTTLTLKTAGGSDLMFELVALFALVGTVASVIVNWIVLRAALQPLSVLERAVDQVRQGNFSVRAERAAFSDPDIDTLAETFNGMLDTVERHRAQLQYLSLRVVNAQEEERKRISRELHDDTAQALTAQLLRLKAVEATGGAADPAVLADLIESTAQTLERVRRMAHELRPPSLDDLGLHASLEGLVAQYRERLALPVTLRADGAKHRLPPVVELTLYRIIQEALTNVAKHANATCVSVTLSVTEQEVVARVVDDGRGFDPAALDRSRGAGLGLFGMQERALLLGGTLSVRSSPGEGTSVEVSVPLHTSDVPAAAMEA